jgi:hypothetical protein
MVLMPAIDALPLSHALKMDDRKRPSPYDQHESGPPSKKLATAANGAVKGHPDADMPWKDDIEVRLSSMACCTRSLIRLFFDGSHHMRNQGC